MNFATEISIVLCRDLKLGVYTSPVSVGAPNRKFCNLLNRFEVILFLQGLFSFKHTAGPVMLIVVAYAGF